jgi:phage protein D
MSSVTPHFLLTLGGLTSRHDRAVGGPVHIHVARAMGGGADALTVQLAQRRGVQPGDDASAELGFDGSTEKVFTGRVVEVAATLAGVRVLALGRMDALLRLRVARSYEDRSVGAIVRDLADAAGLEAGTVDDGPTLPRFAVDAQNNAATHVRALAERLGFELYTDRGGKLMFRALGAAAGLLGGAASGTGYEAGRHLLQASALHRAAGTAAVSVGGEGPASSHGGQSAWWLSTGDDANHGSAGSGEPVLLRFDAAARTKDLADRFASGALVSLQRGTRTLRLRTLGRAALELGDTVQVGKAEDDALNASGYVRTLLHRCTAAHGFVTDIGIEVAA